MPLTLDTTPEAVTLHLHGDLDISLAAELKQLLLDALAQPVPVRVDLQQVSSLNITSIQLLLAAHRHAEEFHHSFTLQGPISHPVAAALHLAGLTLPVSAS